MQASSQAKVSADPYSQVDAQIVGDRSAQVKASHKYLIASFPDLRQVAYMHLPDNVWRPLVVGNVTSPKAVTVDSANSRLYVADAPKGKIFWYSLVEHAGGLLFTAGGQQVAVEGYTAAWMTVNNVGDLYFTGQEIVPAPESRYMSIYRQDATKIARSNPTNPTEIYTRSNTGAPRPAVWLPSGIAVDGYNVYWGNQEMGTNYGALARGSRMNVGTAAADLTISLLSTALEEVRGVCLDGNNVFYVSPNGLFGMSKTPPETVTEAKAGLINIGPTLGSSSSWDPQSIATDMGGTLYITDKTAGIIYQAPSLDFRSHNVTRFAWAPNVHGLTVLAYAGGAHRSAGLSLQNLVLLVLGVMAVIRH